MSNIKVILDKSNLDSIADAVRNQSGDTENYSIDTLVSKTIDSINNPNLQEKSVIPTAEEQIINSDTGFAGLSSVIVEGDEDLIAKNIKRGAEIFGIKGTYIAPADNPSTSTKVKIKINADSYKVNGVPFYGLFYDRVEVGSTITLEYTGDKTFLHWIGDNGKIIGGGEPSCTYSVSAENSISVVTIDESAMNSEPPYCAYIEFMSEYSQIQGSGLWYSTDTPEQHILPKLPFQMGNEALGWTLDGETVCTAQDIINSIDGSFNYKEIRALYQVAPVYATITVGNNIDDTTFTLQSTRGSITVLTKPSTGYENYDIHYWSLDKEGLKPIGYNATNFGFYASHDTNVYIHYVPKGTSVERLSGISILEFYATEDEDSPSIVVNGVRDIASGCKINSYGTISGFNGNIDEETAEQTMVLGNTQLKFMSSTGTSRRSSYSTRISVSSPNTVLWARVYCNFTDAQGVNQTIYSDVISGTWAELRQKDIEGGYIE